MLRAVNRSTVLETGQAKLWILLIGVNRYQDPQLPSLHYCAIDCQGLSEALSDATQSFPQRSLQVRHDFGVPATLSQVRDCLTTIVQSATASDTVLVYFSGHSVLDESTQQPILCLTDTQIADLGNTGLSIVELLEQFDRCSAKQKVVWLDACHQIETEIEVLPQIIDSLRKQSRDPGFYALLSCDRSQQSWAFSELGHGVFTYFLMQGLRGAAADSTGTIDAVNLYKYVYYQTLQYIDKTNQQRRNELQSQQYSLQTPKQIVSSAEPFVLGRKFAAIVPPARPAIVGIDSRRSPYRGLQAFTEHDAEFFYGRERLTQRLLQDIQQQDCLAIVGATGSGKSSVVQAGLIAQLRQGKRILGSEQWCIGQMYPGEHPFESLVNCLASLEEQEQIEGLLYQGAEGLVQWLRTRIESMILLVIDQFEELFTLCLEEVRQDFLKVILEALKYASDRFKLVLILRADFVAAGLEIPELAAILQRSSVLVTPCLSDEDYHQVIVRPAEKAGVNIESEFVEVLLQELDRTPADLPILEFVLDQLWQQGELTLAAYHSEIGELKGALNHKIQAVYNALDPDEQHCARRIFLAVSQIEGKVARRRVPRSALSIYPQSLLDRTLQSLNTAKLIVINADDTIELIHEVLIHHWLTLREWLDEHRDQLRIHSQIEQSAIEWRKSNRPPDLLLRGMRLAEAEELYTRYRDEISPVAQALIAASLSAYQGEQPALKRRLNHADRKVSAIAATAFAAFGLGSLALWSQRNAQIREVQALSASSEALLSANQQLESLTAATQAGKQLQQLDRPWNRLSMDVKISAIATLQQAITQTQELNRLVGHLQQVNDVRMSPDDQTIATVSNDGSIKLWSREGQLLTTLVEHRDRVLAVDFSSNNQLIATASADRTIKLWNRNGTLLQTLTGHQNWVTDVQFSSDSRSLVSSSRDGAIKLWQLEQRQEVQTFRGHKGWVNSVGFGQSDRQIISGGEDGTVRFWQVGESAASKSFEVSNNRVNSVMLAPNGQSFLTSANTVATLWTLNGKAIATLKGHRDRVNTASYSPDGQTIATGSDDQTIRLWDLKGTLLQTIQGHEAAVAKVRFSPTGTELLSASEDKTARLWQATPLPRLDTGLSAMSVSPDGSIIAIAAPNNTIQLRQSDRVLILRGHTAPITQVQFSPDNSLLISASADQTIRLWNTSTGELIRTIVGHNDRVTALSFNPDRQSFASASADRTIKIWAIEGKLLTTLQGHTAEVTSLAFGSDGQLASGSVDSTIRLWDIEQQTSIVLGQQNGAIAALAFSPDSQTLASASRNNTIQLWTVNTATLRQTLIGHSASVTDLSFNQNGSVLASSSDDTTIKLWNTETGELLKTLRGIQDRVLSVAFQPGKLLSTSDRLGLTTWNLNLESLLNQSCDRAPFYLRSHTRSC